MISDRVIQRLIVYRRLLKLWAAEGRERIYSHELAGLAGFTAAQVRRDIMAVAYVGSPAKGYEVRVLTEKINDLLDAGAPEPVALVGVGHLGQALMTYFNRRGQHLSIVAGFDTDHDKVDRVLHGCHCYHASRTAEIIRERGIHVAILAVPEGVAQEMADRLIDAGVNAILNFTPERLDAPEGVFVENVDIAILLEKAAFFARSNRG